MEDYATAGFTHDIKKIMEIISVIVLVVVMGIIVSKVYSDTATQVTLVLLVLGLIVFFT